MSDTRRPASLCWHCDRMVDALTPTGEDAAPNLGDVTLCLYCGAIAFVGPDMALIPPTKDQLDTLTDDMEFKVTFARFAFARQYVMLREHLLGFDAEHGGGL